MNINNYCFSVIQTKDNEICYSEEKHTIFFYDLLHKQIISKLENMNLNYGTNKGFIMINKELLVIPGINKITIINLNKYNLIRIIDIPNSKGIAGVCMLNKNILFTGDKNGIIRKWKIEGNILISISIKENAHDDLIYFLLNIGYGYIASGSLDNSIKIMWK